MMKVTMTFLLDTADPDTACDLAGDIGELALTISEVLEHTMESPILTDDSLIWDSERGKDSPVYYGDEGGKGSAAWPNESRD